jgi:hypothetical protein
VSDAAIFCSKCGAAGQKAGSYCRSCGEWLPDPAGAGIGPGSRLRGLSPERRQRRVHTLQLLTALAAAVAALITLAVHFGAHPDLLRVTVLLCLLVVAWQGVAFFLGRGVQGRRGQELAGGGPSLPAAQGGAVPALNAADTGDLVRPPSVAENTTALLDPVPLKKGGKQ